ncbi:HEPN domain-containing protein [Nocardia takedensis]|uniref:HEPN domain-containing protein n=1 Tax=Nocardia takedensis TaxID=259390 RepID=UPI0012F6567A|nr:HEPN domain-containing protein [Nocardia takedensis]
MVDNEPDLTSIEFFSNAYVMTYLTLRQDVQNLLVAHPSQSGSPGRPAGDTGPLLRSAIVLMHTAWENYVEQTAIQGLDDLLRRIGSDHTKLPRELRSELGKTKNPWALAGDGWKAAAKNAVAREADQLNTPTVEKTENLLNLAIGLPTALHTVSWQGTSNQKVRASLDEFVTKLRGEIVHKGTTPGRLHKGEVEGWIKFFDRLVSQLDSKVLKHLDSVH